MLNEFAPYFELSYIDHSYAGLAGRGQHRALLQYLQWYRRHHFVLHLDVRRYFPSVHLPTLNELVFRHLSDPRSRIVWEQLLRSGRGVYRHPLAVSTLNLQRYPLGQDCGLPLGSHLSQWAGNFYLNGLDHYVKRELKVGPYLRYMDDFVLFGEQREGLEQAAVEIGEWLRRERRLSLNPAYRNPQATRAPSLFLGFRVSRAGIGPSRRMRRALIRRSRAAMARGPEALARTLIACRGWWQC